MTTIVSSRESRAIAAECKLHWHAAGPLSTFPLMKNDDFGMRNGWTRRHFLQVGASSMAAVTAMSCSDPSKSSEFHGDARLGTQVATPTSSLEPGTYQIGLGSPRDGQLFIPSGYQADTAATLVVLLHGAGGSGTGITTPFAPLAESADALLLAPDSRYRTWDVILEDFGPDVAFIDEMLAWVFERVNVDPARLTIAGFSDGATYALALGLSNGTLFQRVIAFSPGFLRVRTARGKPPVFMTHGENDPVLPISITSRTIVPALEEAGYTVDYHEFEGGHVIDQSLAEQALGWAATP